MRGATSSPGWVNRSGDLCCGFGIIRLGDAGEETERGIGAHRRNETGALAHAGQMKIVRITF